MNDLPVDADAEGCLFLAFIQSLVQTFCCSTDVVFPSAVICEVVMM